MGGLSKKAYQIDKYSKEYSLPAITLDGGGLLFKNNNLSPSLKEQSIATAEGIVGAYNLMNYDAVGISERDLAAGIAFLLDIQKRSEFPWVSANIIDSVSKQNIFTSHIIKDVGELKVAVIGITGPAKQGKLNVDNDIILLPWQEVLPPLISELSANSDLVVLLSSYSMTENGNIAKTFNNLHLIIHTGQGIANFTPRLLANTLICQTGRQGKYLGMLQITWQRSKVWGSDNLKKLMQAKKNELGGINGRLARYRKRFSEESLAGNSGYQQLFINSERVQSEIAELETTIQQKQSEDSANATYKNRFISMKPSLPDDEAVLNIVEKTKQTVNEIGRQAAERKIAKSMRPETPAASKPIPAPFTGYTACKGCHPKQTVFWEGTRHFVAYKTLEDVQQNFNLECLECHVTFDRKNLDSSILSLPSELQQVGCEACHGPGEIHVSNSTNANITRKPSADICTGCHTADRDDNFDYKSKRIIIGCPAQ